MIAFTSPYFWYTTRATGLVTLVLFTTVVALGALVATRAGGRGVGRFELNELHRSLSTVAMVFLALHVLSTVLDGFVKTGWFSIVVPFVSHYRAWQVALGAVAFDLIIAVWASSLLKARVKNTSWRFIHWFSWMAVVVALAHGFTTGTDARHGVGLVVEVGCALALIASALARVVGRPPRAAGRTALSPLTPTRVTTPRPTPAKGNTSARR